MNNQLLFLSRFILSSLIRQVLDHIIQRFKEREQIFMFFVYSLKKVDV